jgi:hypothetical protein
MSSLNRLAKWLVCFALLASTSVWSQYLRNETIDSTGKGWTRAWVDADGDGRDDFCFLFGDWDKDLRCYLNKATGTVPQDYTNLWEGQGSGEGAGFVRWNDLNGDGYADICRVTRSPSPRLTCRLGPNFATPLDILYTLTDGPSCESNEYQPGVAYFETEWPAGRGPIGCHGFNIKPPDVHFADVTGDGIPDFCYVYQTYTGSGISKWTTVSFEKTMRCRIATVGPNRSTVSYGPETSPWISPALAMGMNDYPQGFYDFNGDGRADYCRVLTGGSLRCTIASGTGFASEAGTPVGLGSFLAEGSAFVDANGDGNVDFCRIDGPSTAHELRCTLSNGVGWEYGTGPDAASRQITSPVLDEVGHKFYRWWVDINADGLPDFCRLAASPEPLGSGTSDVSGTLRCTLGRGGGDSSTSKIAFSYSDVIVSDLNLGRADGGRGFCDALGTGIQTFCRATRRAAATGQQCSTNWESGQEYCYETYADMHGYYAGYTESMVQARQSLLTAYSDGVGAETRLTYLPLTSAEVYSRSNTTSNTDSRILLMQPRSPVVYETRAWTVDSTPTTLTGNARYLYKDLRTDIWSGSRGFRERWIYNEGSNTVDHVVYHQGLGPPSDANSVKNDLREVGIAKCQEKYAVVGGLIPVPQNLPNRPEVNERIRRLSALREKIPSTSAGVLCSLPDTNPSNDYPFVLLQVTRNTTAVTEPENPRTKFVGNASVKSWDWNGSTRVPLPDSETTTRMDDVGNVLSLVQVTKDSANREWRKTTTNTYGADDRAKWFLGRLTRSEVRTLTPTAAAQLAANGSSAGTSANADRMSPTTPVSTPIHPAALAAILQLLLDD